MYKNKSLIVVDHVKENATVYLFMIILFLTGIVFGAILVNSMNFIQKQELFFYLERFFGQIIGQQDIKNVDILKSSFLYHSKYLLLLFILGLSVIGLPIVWVLLFIKGLVVGFSIGFIVNQLGFKGLLLASLSIAPQNIIIIPIYITAGSLAMIFSLKLLNKLFARKISQPVFQPFGRYFITFAFLLLFSFIAALLEAFVANETMELLIKSFY
ncbi:stage II sporulation protein M [Virgibacillus halodenitrificans]|uniref:Stage II sporulation protein M n=1 Tax=Virgibacillus halodenitrificans TaxID=1482 RepID=A0ABR7VL77_VIRHA|nr:stage II sporulation protein M [Virgibacillus halodenitrificans]MBD1222674.1 stage II sporulation protein M [Virgibacillus halodenitrificans]MCJ0930943.1 stage II sporulation protein M [Virgibacillus halodenitrificans]MYL46940.1 stage II sporulation protein M [Virgibacillus halodenitrificans]MYL57072.1 stage II sporulation protein M [Virgibacillus halodenitrificans]